MNVIENFNMEEEKQIPGLVKIEEERRKTMKMRKRMKKKIRKYKNKIKAKEIKNEETTPILNENISLTTNENTIEQDNGSNTVELEQINPQQQHQDQINIDVEYSVSAVDLSFLKHCDKSTIEQFSKVIDRFNISNNNDTENEEIVLKDAEPTTSTTNTLSNETNNTISKKKLKKAKRFTVEELKELALVPQVVEPWDISAVEPLLLLDLKSYRNTVQVPNHWRSPEKYLFSHYSDLRSPYELPDFIKNTGIMESRERLKKQEMVKRSKTKKNHTRRPRLGKLDLEYEALYDAFFKYQTKPNITIHGDLYEERKQISSKFNTKKYGELSDELKEALGMTSPLTPPPWLIQMQRYGPPPSYKHIAIPGLNSSIPEGAKWGYQNHGWGKIPVDEFNRPLYGNPFCNNQIAEGSDLPQINRQLWGELEYEDTDDDNDNDEKCENKTTSNHIHSTSKELIEGDNDDHIITKPINIDMQEELIRSKRQKRHHTNNDGQLKLYEIIPSKQTNITGFFGSQQNYDVDKLQMKNNVLDNDIKIKNTGYIWNSTKDDITVSLDPKDLSDEYGLDKNVIRNEYQNAQKERLPSGVGEKELTNMYMDYAKRQAMKLRQKEEKKKVFKF